MNHINLSALDLNLLVTLQVLLKTRNVTVASQHLHKTQSAVSHALNRLREQFGDPLLVRSGNEMRLTSRAHDLIEPLETLLHQTQALYAERGSFDPARLTRTFTLATVDYSEALFLPELLQCMAREAPQAGINQRYVGSDPEAMVQQGDLDLAVLVSYRELSGLMTKTLFTDELICVVREEHPRLRCDADLTLDTFVNESHLLISPRGKPGSYVDNHLKQLGLRRHVAATSSYFLSAPFAITKTDHILTMPRRLARRLIDEGWPLRALTPPIELPTFRMVLLFHQRMQNDPANRWLRELIEECCYSSVEQ